MSDDGLRKTKRNYTRKVKITREKKSQAEEKLAVKILENEILLFHN